MKGQIQIEAIKIACQMSSVSFFFYLFKTSDRCIISCICLLQPCLSFSKTSLAASKSYWKTQEVKKLFLAIIVM